jgi:putative membrane protein insertion efficiency factor
MGKFIQRLISFYQKYLSIFSYGSCRYHPTCSTYAKQQFEHNNIFKAILFSTIRILKCNPLFRGGFDYVKVKCNENDKLNLKFKKIKVKYWRIPADENHCLIVQHNKIWDK